MIVPQFVAGLWLGLWFVCGNALWSGGVLIISLQYYAWLVKGLWRPVSLQGVYRVFELSRIAVPWPSLQPTLDGVFLLPAAPVFILMGIVIAGAAKFGMNSIDRRASHCPPRTVNCDHRRALHDIGISTLHIHDHARR
jgi:hypothetical protein